MMSFAFIATQSSHGVVLAEILGDEELVPTPSVEIANPRSGESFNTFAKYPARASAWLG